MIHLLKLRNGKNALAICKFFYIFLSRDVKWLDNLFILGLFCILLDNSLVMYDVIK